MVNAGRILIITRGLWSNLVNYEQLDLVSLDGVAYLARQASVGVDPSTDLSMTYWQPFGSVAGVATTTEPGLVMPDGETIKIGEGGLIYVDTSGLEYDNTTSGLTATDVQSAIDEAVALAKLVMGGVAPLEKNSTASAPHALNNLFFYDGHLYKATAAIAQGATITPGTNCSQTTISAEIAAINTNKANKSTVINQTLAANATQITFTGLPTTGDHLIDFFTSTGIDYTSIDTSVSGQVTLEFEAQAAAVTVTCEIKEG